MKGEASYSFELLIAHIQSCSPAESFVVTSQAVHLWPTRLWGCFGPSSSIAGPYWQFVVLKVTHIHIYLRRCGSQITAVHTGILERDTERPIAQFLSGH